jgi:wyosine [tRNA(Phe)-imidazoG37] synthetase (radical SAM superfamily)
MKYVYGPVPSRRLGQSLGIDPIPLKTCNWNCVYCQLGRTKPVVSARACYFPPEVIVEQVEQALSTHKRGEIDWVTFVGSGEPTLHTDIGWMIREVKALSSLPVAVITNGSLLYLPIVREELAAADAVLPSVDAGTAELYRKINRPHPEITFQRHLEGLITFGHEYKGKLWPEVMLVRDLNDTEEALWKLVDVFHRIDPDEVHINLPTRPPAEIWVRPPSAEGLMRATALMKDIARVVHPIDGIVDLSGDENLIDAVIGIISRHPMREMDLERTLAQWAPAEIAKTIAELKTDDRAQVIERYGTRFWCAGPSLFPNEPHNKTPGFPSKH